jgi:hypothetical protein
MYSGFMRAEHTPGFRTVLFAVNPSFFLLIEPDLPPVGHRMNKLIRHEPRAT